MSEDEVCGCESSEFGCCLDLKSSATGPYFEGERINAGHLYDGVKYFFFQVVQRSLEKCVIFPPRLAIAPTTKPSGSMMPSTEVVVGSGESKRI